mmetsp:Transcript_42055/g.105757  ORF Transcript_42055/g.105757 Transcript_42055/m.105757 type:complete len:207 (-) Transcript_42055:840-1460(-)
MAKVDAHPLKGFLLQVAPPLELHIASMSHRHVRSAGIAVVGNAEDCGTSAASELRTTLPAALRCRLAGRTIVTPFATDAATGCCQRSTMRAAARRGQSCNTRTARSGGCWGLAGLSLADHHPQGGKRFKEIAAKVLDLELRDALVRRVQLRTERADLFLELHGVADLLLVVAMPTQFCMLALHTLQVRLKDREALTEATGLCVQEL